MIFYININYVY